MTVEHAGGKGAATGKPNLLVNLGCIKVAAAGVVRRLHDRHAVGIFQRRAVKRRQAHAPEALLSERRGRHCSLRWCAFGGEGGRG